MIKLSPLVYIGMPDWAKRAYRVGIPPGEYTIESIVIRTICQMTGYSYSEIVSPNRKEDLVMVRHCCMYFLRRQGHSLPKIGDMLKRDHATVLHGTREFAKRIENNSYPKYKELFNKINPLL
jgi:chromosomal replication initiation ATPase DnaA